MAVLSLNRQTRAVVTGGAGFIGSHLVTRLLGEGVSVTILTRHTETPQARHLEGLGARLVACDLATADPPEGTIPSGSLVFHLAADTSVSGPRVKPANVEGTRRVLAMAERVDSPYILFASSIEAQGLAVDGARGLDESEPCRPVSEYGRSKLDAEALVSEWAKRTGRPAGILRIGNTYGPGSAWLLHSALQVCLGLGSIHSVWEPLRHRRFQPLYVHDLVEALIRLAALQAGGLYNVTPEHALSVQGYLLQVGRLLGVHDQLRARLEFTGSAMLTGQAVAADFAYFLLGDPQRCHRVYDNRKLRDTVGEFERWPLARGLASTLAWYRESGRWQALLQSVQFAGRPICTSH